MSRVRSKDTKPEKLVRSIIHRLGYRFRLHVDNLPGKPDIVLPRHRKIVEVQGCFWHQHPGCSKAEIPASNSSFWAKKLARNAKRDRQNHETLQELGWDVLVVWECQTSDVESLTNTLIHFLRKP